jgi:hypothetical protein
MTEVLRYENPAAEAAAIERDDLEAPPLGVVVALRGAAGHEVCGDDPGGDDAVHAAGLAVVALARARIGRRNGGMA